MTQNRGNDVRVEENGVRTEENCVRTEGMTSESRRRA